MSESSLEICSCSALRQASRHVTRLYDSALVPVGLSLNQYAVLAKLSRFGPHNLHDLASRLVMDRSSLGHLLQPLQERGLLEIRVSPTDRRQRVIALTPSGIELTIRAKLCWTEAERRFEASFGSVEAIALRDVLRRVTSVDFSA